MAGFSFKRSYQHYAFYLVNSLLILVISFFLDDTHARIVNVGGNCDFYKGSWVYDESYPLYDSLQCPFIPGDFHCLSNGRPDKQYLKYRWSPTGGCDPPRFDGLDLVNRFKGKKIMFVGDSISNNQWVSFACMIHAAIPNANFTTYHGVPMASINFTVSKTSFINTLLATFY